MYHYFNLPIYICAYISFYHCTIWICQVPRLSPWCAPTSPCRPIAAPQAPRRQRTAPRVSGRIWRYPWDMSWSFRIDFWKKCVSRCFNDKFLDFEIFRPWYRRFSASRHDVAKRFHPMKAYFSWLSNKTLWPFQEPMFWRYLPHFSGLFFRGIYPQNMALSLNSRPHENPNKTWSCHCW